VGDDDAVATAARVRVERLSLSQAPLATNLWWRVIR
jgi:hypothetical protein